MLLSSLASIHRSRVVVVAISTAVVVGLAASSCAAPSDDDLESSDSALAEQLRCTSAGATKLANVAKQVDGKHSQHLCYRYVKAHLRAAGFATAALESAGYGGSAAMFAEWAKKNPAALTKMGLKKVTPSLDALPRGALLVWRRGQCGYSSAHGHIEIVIDDNSSRACSDFCGRIKKTCGLPDIFVPTTCGSGTTSSSSPDKDNVDDDSEGNDDNEKASNSDVPTPPSRPQGMDDCADKKSDGWYCSDEDFSLAFFCQGGASVDTWSCADKTVCRPASDGRATLYGGKNPGCFGSR